MARAPQCWACLCFLKVGGQGVALDGGTTPHVCKACWAKLTTWQRLQITLVCRPQRDGGLGLKEAAGVLSKFVTPAWLRRN